MLGNVFLGKTKAVKFFVASYCWVSQISGISGMVSQISDLLDRGVTENPPLIEGGAVLVSNTSDVHSVLLGKMSNLTTRVHGDL